MQTYTPGITHLVSDKRPMEETQQGCCRIRVVTGAYAFIRISKEGEPATMSDMPLVPNVPEFLNISHGGVKVTAIGGQVYVTEIS